MDKENNSTLYWENNLFHFILCRLSSAVDLYVKTRKRKNMFYFTGTREQENFFFSYSYVSSRLFRVSCVYVTISNYFLTLCLEFARQWPFCLHTSNLHTSDLTTPVLKVCHLSSTVLSKFATRLSLQVILSMYMLYNNFSICHFSFIKSFNSNFFNLYIFDISCVIDKFISLIMKCFLYSFFSLLTISNIFSAEVHILVRKGGILFSKKI